MLRKKSIIPMLQYLGMYLMAAFVGGSILKMPSEVLCAVAFGYSIFLLLIAGKIDRVNKTYMCFLLSLFGIMFISYMYSFGKIGWTSCSNMFVRFLLVYAIIECDEKSFINRFLKFSAFVSAISLMLFLLVKIRILPVRGILIGGNITSMIFYNYTPVHNSQNIGMFGEPGQYIVFLGIALYLVRHAETSFQQKTINRYIVLFIVTIISAQSTAGFIMLGGLLLLELLKSDLEFRNKLFIIVLIIGFVVYILFFAEKNSSLYYHVVGKILTDNNTIDLSGGSGSARTDSFEMFFNMVKENPKMLWGIGFDTSQALGFTSCTSLVGNIIAFGLPIWIVYHSGMLYCLIKSGRSVVELVEYIYIFIITESSQPNILNIFLIVPICYYLITTQSRKKYDDYE